MSGLNISNFNSHLLQMDAPQNNEWGPEMWKILHGLSEKIGNYPQVSHRYITNAESNEEKRLWTILLTSLRLSLPCPLCRKHYTEYINHQSPNRFLHLDNIPKEEIRKWLFNLHNSINEKNQKPFIPIENITELYRNINFSYSLHIVVEHMRRGLTKQWVTRDDIGRTIRVLKEMFAFYSCY